MFLYVLYLFLCQGGCFYVFKITILTLSPALDGGVLMSRMSKQLALAKVLNFELP